MAVLVTACEVAHLPSSLDIYYFRITRPWCCIIIDIWITHPEADQAKGYKLQRKFATENAQFTLPDNIHDCSIKSTR